MGRSDGISVIVAVEGPSAAGKTTWCRRHYPGLTVWEAPPSPSAPDRSVDPTGAEDYWAAQNSHRWLKAVQLEGTHGLAICDTDPFKLHYAWCLRQLGHLAEENWLHAVSVHRALFTAGVLGIADLVLVALPDADTLRQRKLLDASRTRRSFELHLSFAGPLEEWYRAISVFDPERVVWFLPDGGLEGETEVLGARPQRTGRELFDRLIAALPE